MRSWWLLLATGAWLASVAAAAHARVDCDGRELMALDGSASELDDCHLAVLLERAYLRDHLRACVQKAGRQLTRVYGTLGFQLDLHPGGGVSNLRFVRSAFDKTRFPDCVSRVLRRRLAGARKGKPAALEGRLTISHGAEQDFGISLSGLLVPRPRGPPPLPGSFARSNDGLLSSCALGRARMFLRLDPVGYSLEVSWSEPLEVDERIEACLALAEEEPEGPAGNNKRKKKRKKRSARTIRRQVTACLVNLLAGSDWPVRAAAAEELARGWRWRGRRAIQRAVEGALRSAGCGDGDGNGNGNGDGRGDGAKGDQEEKECPLVAPVQAEAGHALVRMVRAHLRLHRRSRQGVLAALAGHPDRDVRLRLVDTILSRWQRGIPEGLTILVRDPDSLVRARAQQLGCERADWESLKAFRSDLRDPDVQVRANALIHARACARRAVPEVTAAARDEKNVALALLMLRTIPTPQTGLLLERAGPALFDPCPLVRYMAARLLFRLTEVPDELLQKALERESDPLLKQQLQELAGRSTLSPPRRTEQLWIQAAYEQP